MQDRPALAVTAAQTNWFGENAIAVARKHRAARIAAALAGSAWRVLAGLLLAAAALLLASGGSLAGLAVAAAIFVASLTSSIAGFAFSAICGAMLFHIIDAHVRVVEIMAMCSIANQVLMIWSLRHRLDWHALAPFLVGGMLGLPVGLLMLLATRHDAFVAAFGALLVVVTTYRLLRPAITLRPRHAAWDVLVGMAGGLTGGAAAFPGAPVTIWCGLKGWDKERQRALYQPFILVMQVAALAAVMLLRPATPTADALLATDWLYVSVGLIGTWFGMTLFGQLNDRQFARVVSALLLAAGFGLIL